MEPSLLKKNSVVWVFFSAQNLYMWVLCSALNDQIKEPLMVNKILYRVYAYSITSWNTINECFLKGYLNSKEFLPF